MTQAFNHRIAASLELRKQQGLQRKIVSIEKGNTSSLVRNNKEYINFSSNDYLGLAADKKLAKAWQKGIDLYGNGSGASPLVTGFSSAHQALEDRLCDWLGYSRAILFSSGFSANQAMLFSLLEKQDLLLQDKLNHASLIEAGMLCPATMKRFHHNDVNHLSMLISGDELANSLPDGAMSRLVVTEGVFSMDGDLAPLADIAEVTQQRAWLAVDDAHGIGVLGNEGQGSCHLAGIKPQLLVVTFGKAFGLSGAAIMCDEMTGEYLTQFARHHVYSTAMPPSQAYALTQAVNMVATEQWRRDKLAELYHCYDQQLNSVSGYQYTPTPIKPFVVGEAEQAVQLAECLKQKGWWLTAIRPPTVSKGKARLRVTLTANHTKSQVSKLACELRSLIEG
ncbi:8-amino-7-oxononanoate synthase [Vibrio sp. 404]|uniref:8-amino-7-oxononanoate synthase n=1 Tax=Vibrio marinisediminis TaxID=2758441 RepID=A0A7W2ITP8_9VIBR|nr:8-amino-7-oxononanoate synthase [Vibrio marinisediminis]MBA5762564.1 8-amino-7-oxononanoate synthase [Vibrio marinisediminis]